ncbi:MAG: chlorophyllide a reductase subunit Z [Caldilineaceae bacterium]|nr:chlorophyllide a reductase subunit Z [Caldilineaceae bacterium]
MSKVIRDLSDTSSYWAAAWTICPMPDVHVICDAPIGCFNLVATAVSDYTDAVPHIENITPSVMREAEVGGTGTGPAVRRTYEGLRDEGILDGKHLIVVSTAESEMIGSDLSDLVTQLQAGTRFFFSDSLSQDEWFGRDRILQWLWDEYGSATAGDITVEPGLVNIIGPTYGCFNSPSDLHEVRRLIEGAGGKINLVYPYEARLSDTAQLARAQVNVVMYHEFGHTLADTLGQPWLHAPMGMQATTTFLRRLGKLLGTAEQAEAFIAREKRTTLQPVWDLWRGPQGDWFSTTTVGVVGTGTYVDGLKAYLGEELGMPITLSAARPLRKGEPDNEVVRQKLHAQPPAFLFGSINEKIYLSEGGARHTSFIPAAFPGPIVRRALGTPFMGYSGAVYLLQEIVNRLYEVLFNFLPVDTAYSQQRSPNGTSNGVPHQGKQVGNLPWQPEAKTLLDAALEQLPFLPRISASRELQMKAEMLAQDKKLQEVTAELVQELLSKS